MSTVELKFTFKKEPSPDGYSIQLDDEILGVQNHEAVASVEIDIEHRLEWEFPGNPGDKLTIEGKVNGVLKVKSVDTIPPGEVVGVGQNQFTIEG